MTWPPELTVTVTCALPNGSNEPAVRLMSTRAPAPSDGSAIGALVAPPPICDSSLMRAVGCTGSSPVFVTRKRTVTSTRPPN
ncbi:MAG TPA: hypothetical protein VGN51_06330 [Acidimicrobiia bacterium]